MIHQLIPDIYNTISTPGWFANSAEYFSTNLTKRLQIELGEKTTPPRLRLSQLGPRCPRALWASVNKPEEATPIPPWANNTYAYGHIVEMLTLTQAKAAGHSVEGEQDELIADGVYGHRDCILDGHIVDIKSCGRYGFEKFKKRTILQDDLFGYLDQLDAYMYASLSDDRVKVHNIGYILAVDKQLGHMVLYKHELREENIKRRIRAYQDIVASPTPPQCTCKSIPFGSSGNKKLDTQASYSVFRHYCFPELRTFIYSDGPVYLSKVVKEPNVMEVSKYGVPIHIS